MTLARASESAARAETDAIGRAHKNIHFPRGADAWARLRARAADRGCVKTRRDAARAVARRRGVEGSVGETYVFKYAIVRSFDRSINSFIHSFIVVNGRDDDDGVDGDARARFRVRARGPRYRASMVRVVWG